MNDLNGQFSHCILSMKDVPKNNSFQVAATVIFCIILVAANTVLAQESKSPKILLEKSLRTYSELSSYKDSGIIERETGVSPNVIYKKTQFSQWIKRPNLERIEWVNNLGDLHVNTGILVSNESEISLYDSSSNVYAKKKSVSEVEQAGILGSAFGLTEVSVFTVRNLMAGDWRRNQLNSLENLKLEKIETFEDSPCYVISGLSFDKAMEFKIWISTDDYLIRQIELLIKSSAELRRVTNKELHKLGDPLLSTPSINNQDTMVLIRESHRYLTVDADIQDSVFDFIPPKGATFSADLSFGNKETGLQINWPGMLLSIKRSRSFVLAMLLIIMLIVLSVLSYKFVMAKKKNGT